MIRCILPMFYAGQLLGHYRIIKPLSQGGMGTVYQAVHETLGRPAAIKEIHPEIAGSPDWVQRFLNEARAVNLIAHPNIVQIYEIGASPEGTPFLVMELLEGQALDQRRQQAGGRLLAEAPAIGRQIALALQAAHEKGIVHRDLKPANVMLVHDLGNPGQELVKVLDFGIAKLDDGAAFAHADFSPPRTRTGVRMGTPEYMAPEQCIEGARVDAKADVYALGVSLYELVSGRRPFSAEHSVELMTMHVRQAPPFIKSVAPDVPDGLAALIHAMLRKRPEERPTMAEVAQRLGELKETARSNVDPSQPNRPAPQTPAMDLAPPLRRPRASAWRLIGGAMLLTGTLAAALGLALHWPGRSRPVQALTPSSPSAAFRPRAIPSQPLVHPQAKVDDRAAPTSPTPSKAPLPLTSSARDGARPKQPATGTAKRPASPSSDSRSLFEDLTPVDP